MAIKRFPITATVFDLDLGVCVGVEGCADLSKSNIKMFFRHHQGILNISRFYYSMTTGWVKNIFKNTFLMTFHSLINQLISNLWEIFIIIDRRFSQLKEIKTNFKNVWLIWNTSNTSLKTKLKGVFHVKLKYQCLYCYL